MIDKKKRQAKAKRRRQQRAKNPQPKKQTTSAPAEPVEETVEMEEEVRDENPTNEEQEAEEVHAPAPRKTRLPRWVYPIIGMLIIVIGLVGAGFAVIKLEEKAADQGRKDAIASEQAAQRKNENQCVAISQDTVLITGNPTWDKALQLSLTKMDAKQRAAFTTQFLKTGDPTKNNPTWKEDLTTAQQGAIAVEPSVQITPNKALEAADAPKDAVYTEGAGEFQELDPGTYVLKYLVQYEDKSTSNISLVLSTRGTDANNKLVFPAEIQKNKQVLGTGLTDIQPLC